LAKEFDMAILRSLDGNFYEIPDDVAARYLIPPDKVKEKLKGTEGEQDSLADDALKTVRGGNASAWHNAWQNRHESG
jgi:hypothetical protein